MHAASIAVGGAPVILLVLAYLGGVLTILSPCVLPVLPFVFARSDQPFARTGLPLLAGMALTFAAVASLAALGGSWAVQANAAGRWAALLLLALFGAMLLSRSLSDRLTRPVVALGGRLSAGTQPGSAGAGPASSFLLGVATGLLWAPCAGPILGLVLTGAALHGASVGTTLLLLAYALGAATSLAAALLIGGRVFAGMKRSLGAGEWVRRGLGVAVLAGVAAIALGLDRGVLTRLSNASTGGLEQGLIDRLKPAPAPAPSSSTSPSAAAALASLKGATGWLNTPPLTPADLRGKVVVVDFWTYSCINCLRSLPYVKAWDDRYRGQGLVVIGVHTPEFPFEKDPANVAAAVRQLGVRYPVALDNDYAIWRGFQNNYWPAHYFIDAQGRLRGHHFGEGDYAGSERLIRGLLAERNGRPVPGGLSQVAGAGVQTAADVADRRTGETYIGYARAANFASPGGLAHDSAKLYRLPPRLAAGQWALAGNWRDLPQSAVLARAGGRIAMRFHARDLHLVLGPAAGGKPVRFRVRIDGDAPGADHGLDTDAQGQGTVTANRLYQLVRQSGPVRDRLFEIEFLDPGVEAFSFTFG